MIRSLNERAGKMASSSETRSPETVSSTTKYRCSSPGAAPGSNSLETTFHCARAATASASASKMTSALLNLGNVPVDQSLKPWVAAERVPNRIDFQTLDGDSARSV